MNCFTILAIFCVFSFSLACLVINDGSTPEATPSPSKKPLHPGIMVGGVSKMSEEELEDPGFQAALKELMKKLDEANACYTFELLKVVEASKQVVSGMKYIVKLEVKPVFIGDGKSECSQPCYTSVQGPKKLEASIWSQPWLDEDPHKVTFIAKSVSSHFNESGELALC